MFFCSAPMNKTDSTRACSGAVARDAPTPPPLGDSVVTLVLQATKNPRQFPAGGLSGEVSDDQDQKLR
jgi:hypothetical protein